MSIHDLWKDFVAIKKDIPVFYREWNIPDKKKSWLIVSIF